MLEDIRNSKERADQHVVTALRRIDEHVDRILSKLSINLKVDSRSCSAQQAVGEVSHKDEASLEVDMDMLGTACDKVVEVDNSDSAWRKRLDNFLDHSPDINVSERIKKLELELAAALIDKNIGDHASQASSLTNAPRFKAKALSWQPKAAREGNALPRGESHDHTLATVRENEEEDQPSIWDHPGQALRAFSFGARSFSFTSLISRNTEMTPPPGIPVDQVDREDSEHGSTASYPVEKKRFSRLDEAPQRAFVINARRLIATQKILHLLHELINSSAIAALTLVQAGTTRQLFSTVGFLTSVVLIFTMHDNRWDHIDIADTCTLLPLLSNDNEDATGNEVHNPNRMLKAMSFTVSGIWYWVWRLLHVIGVTCCTISWLVLVRYWGMVNNEEQANPMEDAIDAWVHNVAQDEDDGAALGMQVTVGTLMFVLHLLFEYIYGREMCAVMPLTTRSQVWDPRQDGVPFKFWWFGLPSMWFTTEVAHRDLFHWMDSAHPTKHIFQIYPQELALYALSGHEQRAFLKDTLKEAKLFDGKLRKFITREVDGEEKYLNLGIELCFYDGQLQKAHCPFPGEFLELGEAGDHVIRRSTYFNFQDMVDKMHQLTKEF